MGSPTPPTPLSLRRQLFLSIAVLYLYVSSSFTGIVVDAASDSEEVDKTTSSVLAEEVLKIPLEQFEGDDVLIQKFDSATDSTQFWHPNNGIEPVYERKGQNTEDVLVLSRKEDKLENGKTHSSKQTYVVLRKSPTGEDKFYPIFAYLRHAKKKENCPITRNCGGNCPDPSSPIQLCIEWDSWEVRVVDEPAIWLDCSSQVFLSCGFNVSVFEKDPQFQSILTTDLGAEDLTNNVEPEVEVDDTVDIINSTDYDFFDDLHGVKQQDVMGRAFSPKKKAKVQPRQDGKLYDLCLEADLSQSPNCFNGLGLSLDLPHPLQYSRPSSTNLNLKGKKPKCKGKPNYSNYQPIGNIPMSPYRKGITKGTFTPDDTALKVIKGSLYVFGPGSLDVFKADSDAFGSDLPDNQGTVGTYSSCKVSDANCMIHGVLIPLDTKTAYMIRSGLAYPATFKTATGIPKTRGFVIPLDNKQIDLFYPDSFVSNNLRLNNPLEKPMSGDISPMAGWTKDFPSKSGLLFPRKWVASIFVRKERQLEYGKFTQLDGYMPPVRVAVTPGLPGLPDDFYSLEEPLLPPHKIPINIAFHGTVTFESGANKHVPAYAIPSARHGEVDKFISSEVYYLERVAFDSPAARMDKVKGLLKLAQANKGEPIAGMTVELYLYRVDLKAPGIHEGVLTREDGSKEEGTLYVDKTVNPLKFTAKSKASKAPKGPSSTSPVLTPVTLTTPKPKKNKNPLKAAPTKAGELRYPTYKVIGTLEDPVRYHVGFETGSFKPDDKTLKPISVKTYILGMDKPDMLQGNKAVFGTLYPIDKGVAGTYVPNNPNPTHEIHGVLIPLNENTGVMFRDGLGYPCSYRISSGSPVKEIFGFYAPSMRKQSEFFYPESFITFKELALPYHIAIEGQIAAEEPLLSEVGTLDGQLLPRQDGVASVFIRTTITKMPGTFNDADGKLPPAKLLVIPGKDAKPDEFFPIDDTLLDSILPVNGTVTTDPVSIPRPATFVRTPNGGTPDIFIPLEGFDVQPIKFHSLKRKMEPLIGVLIASSGVRIPPRVPVDLVFNTLHQQPVPSRLLGNLETEDGSLTRGNIIVNSEDNQLTFFPEVREVPKDELAPGYAPNASQKYNKYVPYGQAEAPKEVTTGVTLGNFVPDTDNNGKPIRIAVHSNKLTLLYSVESEDPVFGRELPDDRGVPGTYTGETRKGKKQKPIHGILIPVDKNRAFFLLDGTGYYGAFNPNDNARPIQGFIVPVKGKSDLFYFETYFESYITPIRDPTVKGKIVPDKSVEDKYPAQDCMLILKKSEPSIIILLGANPEDGTFTPDDSKRKPLKMVVVPKKDGNNDEFYPLDDDDDPGTQPLPGTVKSPTKDVRGTLIPNLLPGASDEFIPEDDPEPSDLVPVTITSSESNLNDIKAFVRLPKGHKGPPQKPTPLLVTDAIQSVPTRLQATMKMPDDSSVVGLMAADSPTGPFTFFPGASNPLPTSLKLMPRYGDVATNAEPADVPTIPEAPEEIKTPVQVSGHKGYPKYVPIGLSDEKIVMKLGVTLGNFVPDEENDRQPLRIAVTVVGPKNLDSVEAEKPIFGQELPEDRGTEGTYTPDEKDGEKGTPIHGVLIPIDSIRGYFLRDGIGYLGKFSPKQDIPPTWGFVIPSQPGIRTADHFYPESFVNFNLKGKPRVDGELEPDKKVKDLYKTRPGELLTRRAEPNILIFKNVGAVDGTFQDDANARPPKKLVVVPENGGNPDEFYALEDDDDNPEDDEPVKGTIKAEGLEKTAKLLPNSVPGAPDTFIPEEEGEPKLVTIESTDTSPLDTVKAYATLPPDQKGPISTPTELTVTKGAEQLPSRMQAKVTVPGQTPVEGLLVSDTPAGPYTFFPGMSNPEPTKPKPLQLVSPDEIKKKDPSKTKPKAKQNEPPPETGRSETPQAPTVLQAADSGDSEDEEESTSSEVVPPETRKCTSVANDYPTYVQFGTSADVVEYNVGVVTGVLTTDDGGKSLPVVVHVVGVDNLDVVESEDPIFGSKLPDDVGTVASFTPDNPKSGVIRGVVLPVTSRKAYIVRDGTAYITTFTSENGEPPVLGFRVPSMIKSREADYFYPQAFSCAIIDAPMRAGEMVPHASVEQFFPKTKGKLILNAWGASVFIPESANVVEGTFQDAGSALPPSKVFVIPETSRKPDEFYPIENVLQNGELTPGKITTPDKELKVTAIARPSKQGPDYFYPEDETVEVVTLISKDRSVPKQKAVILWKVKPKGTPRAAVKIVPLTKTLTLPFKIEVTVLMQDGTFITGLLAQNGAKDLFTLYPFVKDPMPATPTQSDGDGPRKPGSESKYPTYVQYGTSSDPIEYLTGVSAGNIIPEETPDKSYPAVVAVEGIGKLDIVEFEKPVFGKKLPIDKGTIVAYTPNSERGKPLRGVLIPLDANTAYLVRDGLAYTSIFVPHKKKFEQIEGFIFENFDKTKATQPFIPETLAGPKDKDLKGILDGILVPDAETAKFFPDTPGKLVTSKKKPYVFISSKVKVVQGEFQDADKKNPAKPVLVVPGSNGEPDEFYPLEDEDLLPEDTIAPVKGSVTTPDKVTDVVVIPNSAPGTPDTIIPEEDNVVAEVTVALPDDTVKAQMVRPKGEKGRPKKPVDLIINEGLDKLKPRTEGTLNLDDGTTKVPGLLVTVPEDGTAKFYPGVQDILAPTAVVAKEPEKKSKKDPEKASPSPTKVESPPEDKAKDPVDTKYPTYVQYGTSADPVEYRPGGTVGTFTFTINPDEPKREPLPATVFVFGIDKLDIIQFDDPVFGDVLPEKTATVGVYNPENSQQKPIRGVVIPIDERRGYIVRDGIAYTAIFYPKKENAPTEIVGFLIKPLSGDQDTELFVAESYITYEEPLSKQNQLIGSMVPSTEASVFFPSTTGKLLTRGHEPSIYIPDSVEIVPGTFQDETLLYPPIKVHVIPGKDGRPDQIYPIEDDIPAKENVLKGSVTTPWKMIEVSVIPSGSPKIPALIVITEEKYPELVTFEKNPGPVKAYLIQDNNNAGIPTKSTDVVLTKPEDETLPISQEVNLIMPDGKNRTGLLVAKTPGGIYQVFFPGALQPSKQPIVRQVAAPLPTEPDPSEPNVGRQENVPDKRPRKSGLYPTYIVRTPDSGTLEYFIGATEGTFMTDDDPPKSLPVTLNVLGADKLDVIVATTPIFGKELPIDKGTAGTFKPITGGPGPKNPQRSLHGVILPIDETTALVVRDGLAYPVTLYLPESNKDTHGFFIPLLRRPIEVFYPDSIKTFEPIVADVIAASPTNLVPAEIVPDKEIDRLAFPDSTGQIDLNRKGRNRYISNQFPDKVVIFKDDGGKFSIKFKVMEGNGDMPDEFIPIDKDLPEITELTLGTLTDPDSGNPVPNDRVAVLSLPKAADGDITEYEVYPELMFTIREIQVTTRNKKLKNVEGYVITSKKAQDGTPVDIIFKTFKASLTDPKHSATVSFVDDGSVVRGMLFTNHVSGPHTFFPAGGRMQYNSKEPTFEMEGPKSPDAKQNENAPTGQTSPTTGAPTSSKPVQEPLKTEQSRSEPTDTVKPKPAKLKTPTPVFAEENDDWPFNMVYEPTEDNKEAPIPEDKKPDKAIPAIILPMDGQNKKLFAVKGKIPTSTPERGKPLIFLPYKTEEAKISYFRGTLRMPGDPAGDLEGRFRAPKRASTPPVFIVDPLGSDPAVFIANNNPRVEVYGYVISTVGDFHFQPDESIHIPTQPTSGILRITGKQNKVGVLMPPLTPDGLSEFRTDSPKTANANSDKSKPIEVYFYPDLDTIKPIKGTVTIVGDQQSFVPDDAAEVDKSVLPLHGLVVSPTDIIASVFVFLYPAAVDGGPLDFKSDRPGSVLADFRPDNSVDTVIQGVFIPSKSDIEAGQFIVSSALIQIPFNQLGTLDRKNIQGQPAIGMMTERNGKIYFDADDRITIEVKFYPDVENIQPIAGMYVFSKGGTSGEFRPTIGEVIEFSLPIAGQVVPKADTHPQMHGTLKKSPKGTSEFDFEEDPPNTPPDNAVDLVGSKGGEGGTGNNGDSDYSVQIVYIWGMYFVGIGNINIFIPRAGTTGQLVANDRPPTDPNAIKFEGLLTCHDSKTAASGAVYYATFIPDHDGRSNNLAAEFPPTIQIVFYPAGSISGGITGTVIQIDENQWAFIVITNPKEGRWRPPAGVTQFTYDEAGQIVPFDQTMIWFRQQERDKTAGVKIKGGYYKGLAGVNVIVPEAFKSGAMFIISGENKMHGKVYPIDKGKFIKFIPDDEPTAYTKVKEAQNKLAGLLDLDESLSVNGKTPDNGIAGSLNLNELDEFIFTPDAKGQWGYFIPGRKALPPLIIMCFGGSTTGIAGRSLDEAGDQEDGKCSNLKSYYLHEQEGYVIQVCHQTTKVDKVSERSGYYPYSEAGEDDTAEDSDNARGGIAFPMNNGAHLFVSSNGIEGDFLMIEDGKVAIDLDSLSNISGKIFYMPDTENLMFKPTQLSLLLEEAKSSPDGVKGFFKSKLGIAQEGMLQATLRLNGNGVSGVLNVDKPGKFGIVYLTDNEPVVAGSKITGRGFLAEKHAEVGKSHGVLYQTGGTGTFLESHGDVSGVFMYTTADETPANQTVHLHPELGLLYSPSSFTAEFRKTIKAKTTLSGKLYISDEDATIPASIKKSQKAPMAYHFTPTIPFRVGWLSSRKTGEGIEVFFMDDESIDVFQHPGWKTQYLAVEPGVTREVENSIFHGLGNCPSDTRTTMQDYKKSVASNDKLIKFFLKVLRTHCLKKHLDEIKRLVKTGILEAVEETNGKILRVKRTPILSAAKLRKRETEDISAAFSMEVLSRTYVDQLSQPKAKLNPTDFDGNPISRSAYFFHKMVMTAIKSSKEILRPHFVRLMRNMITTLNTAVAKLEQDKDRLARCRGCGTDVVAVINDKKYLTALSQFITHSLRYTNDKDPDKLFKSYYKANKISISKLANKKLRINNNQ